MLKKLSRILSLVLYFALIFEQTGFAQVVAQLDVASQLAGLHSSFVQDKFRPLHLRYLQYNSRDNNFRLFLDKGDTKNPTPAEVETTTKELLNYFFVGITLPNECFWVNLRPDSPDNIIDPLVAQTDVGKILLEADLQLKKDTARMTSPETPEGKDYWNKLYAKAGELFGSENITIPTLTRPWIVPDEIIVRESIDSAYIYKATLKVMLEEDYLKNSVVYSFKDERLKALNEYSSQLIRETIISKLTKEINTSKRYAPLRQVFYSLILAQWFKARQKEQNNPYSQRIDTKNLSNLFSQTPYSVDTYYKAYKENFEKGEYNIKEPAYTPYGQLIRNYFSGGVMVMPSDSRYARGLKLPLGERDDTRPLVPTPSALGKPNRHEAEIRAKLGPEGKVEELKIGESDFAIAGDNQGGSDRREHTKYHREGNFVEVIRLIAEEIDALEVEVGRYDIRGIVKRKGGKIKTKYGELRIEDDDILVIIDNRFQKNHAGRDAFTVYARTEPKAQHEISELRSCAEYCLSGDAKRDGLFVERSDIKKGRLGTKIRQWLNETDVSEGERQRRHNLIIAKRDEWHSLAIVTEYQYANIVPLPNELGEIKPSQPIIEAIRELQTGQQITLPYLDLNIADEKALYDLSVALDKEISIDTIIARRDKITIAIGKSTRTKRRDSIRRSIIFHTHPNVVAVPSIGDVLLILKHKFGYRERIAGNDGVGEYVFDFQLPWIGEQLLRMYLFFNLEAQRILWFLQGATIAEQIEFLKNVGLKHTFTPWPSFLISTAEEVTEDFMYAEASEDLIALGVTDFRGDLIYDHETEMAFTQKLGNLSDKLSHAVYTNMPEDDIYSKVAQLDEAISHQLDLPAFVLASQRRIIKTVLSDLNHRLLGHGYFVYEMDSIWGEKNRKLALFKVEKSQTEEDSEFYLASLVPHFHDENYHIGIPYTSSYGYKQVVLFKDEIHDLPTDINRMALNRIFNYYLGTLLSKLSFFCVCYDAVQISK